MKISLQIILSCSLLLFTCTQCKAQKYPIPYIDWDKLEESKPWEDTEVWNPVPEIVTPGNRSHEAPSDAVILFDGSDLSQWVSPKYKYGGDLPETKAMILNAIEENFPFEEAKWNIESGALIVNPGTGDICTKDQFGSVQLHLEWLAPVDENKEGQLYSNSGIFFMGLYELQLLNSYKNKTYPNGQAGSVYKQHIPLVNANKPPGEWQSYDVVFNAPQFNTKGEVIKPAYVTAFINGVLVQNQVELEGPTLYIGKSKYFKHSEKMPLYLQDHGDKVRYRNIWIREL